MAGRGRQTKRTRGKKVSNSLVEKRGEINSRGGKKLSGRREIDSETVGLVGNGSSGTK